MQAITRVCISVAELFFVFSAALHSQEPLTDTALYEAAFSNKASSLDFACDCEWIEGISRKKWKLLQGFLMSHFGKL